MAGKTGIQWTDTVWNPVTGCTRVSAGCDHCYAFALHDKRYKANRDAARLALKTGDTPATARAMGVALPLPAQYDVPFSRVQLLPERLEEPLHWRKPRRVFVNSMGDLFHPDVPDDYIDRVFAIMALTPQHTYQILTKRPERMREYMSDDRAYRLRSMAAEANADVFWPLPNVWLGTSVEDQAAADERIPHLLATPAAVRFLSCEPLLGPLQFDECCWFDREHGGIPECGVDWVIVGGESGTHARPCNIEWIRDIVRQCRAASVPCFYKQGGSSNRCIHSAHGSHMECFPPDLQVREFPDANA